MELKDMTKDEKSLLLYFEARSVDSNGGVDTRHMNEDDINLAEKWNKENFIKYGRIAFKCLPLPSQSTYWVQLSDEAWKLAAEERKARAIRTWDKRTWKTTEEYKDES